MRIVLTHGRDQAFAVPATMERAWSDALRFGLQRAGMADASAHEIRFAFYGDIWRPDQPPTPDDGERDGGPSPGGGLPRPAIAIALDQPPTELETTISTELLPSGRDEERLDGDRLAAIVRRLDEAFGVGETVLTYFLKDLDEYFRSPNVRRRALAAVRDACLADEGLTLLMAHSMGSIVAYDLMAVEGAKALGVEALVTFGSPLGMTSLRRHIEWLHPGTPFPDQLRSWINIYNRSDFATVVRELGDLYPAKDGRRVTDIEALGADPSPLNPGRAHDPIVYLSSLGLAESARRLLEASVDPAWPAGAAAKPEAVASESLTPALEPMVVASEPAARSSPPPPPPAARAPLREILTRTMRGLGHRDDADRGSEPATRGAESGAAAAAAESEPAMPSGMRTVERMASADFPPIVEPGSTHDLVFTIAGGAVHARAEALAPLVVPADQKVLALRVGVYAADFEVRAGDEPSRTWVNVDVDLDDPDAIAEGRFKLTAHPTDERVDALIYLTFYRGNLPVGQLSLITAIDPVHEIRRAPIAVPIGGAPDPDYVLVVTDRSPGIKGSGPFDISVSKEGEFLNKPLGSFPVTVDAWDYASRRLEGFRRVKDEPSVEDRIRAAHMLGVEMWNDLPEQFQRFYWDELHGNEGVSVAVYSQEPFIPWELIKPQREPGGEEDGLLGAVFNMARWKQAVRFPDPMTVSRFSVIAPEYGPESGSRPLPGAQAEADELVAEFGAVKIPGDRPTVRRLLESSEGVQLIHFAGHGEFSTEAASASIIKLSDAPLVPGDLTQATLGRASHPFVFLNACEVGEQGWALTRIGGWAEAFTDIGFSGFVGPYWAVTDRVARKAAILFYRSLSAGLSVAEAVRQIRLKFYTDEDDAGHPSWLAYTLHCQPNIRIEMLGGVRPTAIATPG